MYGERLPLTQRILKGGGKGTQLSITFPSFIQTAKIKRLDFFSLEKKKRMKSDEAAEIGRQNPMLIFSFPIALNTISINFVRNTVKVGCSETGWTGILVSYKHNSVLRLWSFYISD